MLSTYDYLKCSANVLRHVDFCGLKPPFRWVHMTLHCSRGAYIGVHRLIFLGLLVIFPIVTVVSMPGV